MTEPANDATAPPDRSAPRVANKRGIARLWAVQALYQMDVGETTLQDTLAEFTRCDTAAASATPTSSLADTPPPTYWQHAGIDYRSADADFFRNIVKGVVRHQRQLDPIIHQAIDNNWSLTRFDATLRAIVRAGAYELCHRLDVPVRVIVSEYLDIAHAFFAMEEPGLVNGVLDRIARRFRADEL